MLFCFSSDWNLVPEYFTLSEKKKNPIGLLLSFLTTMLFFPSQKFYELVKNQFNMIFFCFQISWQYYIPVMDYIKLLQDKNIYWLIDFNGISTHLEFLYL